MTWAIVTDKNNSWVVDTTEDVYVDDDYVDPDYVEGTEQVWTPQADKDNTWQS
jgi:hypothetical protein